MGIRVSVDTGRCGEAERAFVAALEGGCSAPVAAYAELEGGRLTLRGLFESPGGSLHRGSVSGSIWEGKNLASQLAARLKGELE